MDEKLIDEVETAHDDEHSPINWEWGKSEVNAAIFLPCRRVFGVVKIVPCKVNHEGFVVLIGVVSQREKVLAEDETCNENCK
jgi:hypothetical protein